MTTEEGTGESGNGGAEQPRELLETVSSSPVRAAILHKLGDGPREDAALRAELDAPRSTVHLNLDRLTATGLIEQVGGRRQLTTRGEAIAAIYGDAVADLCALGQLQPILEHAPLEELNLRVLRSGTVVRNHANRPNAVNTRYAELFERTSELRGFVPNVSPSMIRVTNEQVSAGELTFDVVFPVETMAFIEREFCSELTAHIDTGAGVHHVTERDLPYTLFLFDDVATLGVRDDDGIVRALVELEDSAAIDWAQRTYERERERATRFTLTDLE